MWRNLPAVEVWRDETTVGSFIMIALELEQGAFAVDWDGDATYLSKCVARLMESVVHKSVIL
jgi:hypothetical protein